jgi:hypothetical protein
MNAINHPSYSNTGCTEQAVSEAINASVAAGGEETTLRYSEGAEAVLERECDWTSETECEYRGTDCDGRRWHVILTESAYAEDQAAPDADGEDGCECGACVDIDA